MRGLLPRLALAVAALLVVFLLGEVALRALHALGRVPRVDAAALFPMSSHVARLVRSDDPELFVELDPSDPRVNAHGFRDREYAVGKPEGAIRVLALGDSVTYGVGVPLEDTWPKILESLLDRPGTAPRQVLNFGVPGYGTAEELRLFAIRGRRWDPDVVVVGFNLNDLLPSDVLTHTMEQRMRRQAFFRRWIEWSHLLSLAYERWSRLRGPGLRRGYESATLTRSLQDALDGFVRIHREEVPVLFAIFPRLVDFEDYPYGDLHAWVAGELGERGLPMVDLLPVFARHEVRELQVAPWDTGHPNALGHRLAALHIRPLLAGLRMGAPARAAAEGDDAGR